MTCFHEGPIQKKVYNKEKSGFVCHYFIPSNASVSLYLKYFDCDSLDIILGSFFCHDDLNWIRFKNKFKSRLASHFFRPLNSKVHQQSSGTPEDF